MIVKVKLHDTLKHKVKLNLPDYGIGEIPLPVGATVKELILRLGLEKKIIGLIVVNKRQSGYNGTLKDGDLVEIFSPLAGG